MGASWAWGAAIGSKSGAGSVGEGGGDPPGRYFDAARRDDSCAGNRATTLPTTSSPATTTIAVRDMANPTYELKTEHSRRQGIGRRNLAGLRDFAACGDL
jgi:hypothetical protein